MATIKNVAEHAGVSISTVSHVLNQTRFVSPHTIKRVMEAVQHLQYAPNSLARSLKINQTHTIGLLVTTSANPFFAEVVRGVEARCYNRGYNLILCNTENEVQRQTSYLKMLLEKRVDGLLLLCTENTEALFELLKKQHEVPQVILDNGWPCNFADVIHDNSKQGCYLATRYLIEQGHRQLGSLTGPLANFQAQQRLLGFNQALIEENIEPREDWILEGDFDIASGEQLMQRILSLTEHPTAMVIGNDMMAIGALCAAHKAKVQIPSQLSIIGYDDIELAQYTIPALTTIRQPAHQLGQRAVDLLLKRINKIPEPDSELLQEPQLIERQTVAPPPIA